MDEDEDEYGDIPDADLIEAFSQPSQTLPPLRSSPRPGKRKRISDDIEDENASNRQRRRSRASSGSDIGSGDEEDENESSKKKKKYLIHIADKDVPAGKILGATQAAALPDSSPWRIRGPLYIKPRPEPPKQPQFTAQRQSQVAANFFQKRVSKPPERPIVHQDLEDFPDDFFSSPEENTSAPVIIGSSPLRETQSSLSRQRLVAPQQGLRQTTLFGGRAADEIPASQVKKVHNFIVDKPPEPPTHHILDREALKTWVYPTNLGAIRDYQYSIVKHGLFHNTLVALPTGLGKTFIAATIMYNFYRWTKTAQIVFVAPTKPLVAQQVDACFNIVGIPRSQTTMLTGEQVPALRAEEWEDKRVFFMTPQTLENDLSSGIADPKKICLLVVDEAHRATGNYAYVKVVNFLRRFNKSYRILALTATPGATVESVQDVIDNLEISKVEIRTEESIDIQQYVHQRNIDQIILDPSDEMNLIKGHLAKALQPLVNQLCGQKAYYNSDPMALTPFGVMQARKAWFASEAARGASMGTKGMMHALFSVLASISHPIKLLNFHGIGPFYSSVSDFRRGVMDAKTPPKYRTQITEHPEFKKMMDRVALWLSKEDFIGHPKLTYLCDTILNHFLDAGEGRLGQDAPPSATRVIVFSEYRDSADGIARVLNKHGPMIRASVFVGQQDSVRSAGMNQAKQQETIDQFKSGRFNVLVATSIGEEGLDIGQVDLIVCYDASASPIRMLQRMGRTGRKRAGKIVLLLMRGKEEDAFVKAKDNYEKMQTMITSGTRFNFRHDLSVRILPRDITPVVDRRMMEIPIENSQGLPEPKRRPTRIKKKPAKKFHMPDGVETGFQKASRVSADGSIVKGLGTTPKAKETNKTQVAPIIPVESVFLTPEDELELERRYQNVDGSDPQEVGMPDMNAQFMFQRFLHPTVNVSHGHFTERCVELFKTLASSQLKGDRYYKPYGDIAPSQDFLDPPALVDDENKVVQRTGQPKKPAAIKKAVPAAMKNKQKAPRRALAVSDIESGEDEVDPTPDSEGEGDDLLHSEARSIDHESDAGSIQDFVVEGNGFSSSQILVRSSRSPPPTRAPAPTKGSSYHSSDAIVDEDDEDDLPDLSQLNGRKAFVRPAIELSDDEEEVDEEDANETLRPVSRGRDKRRRVVEETDSDE